MQAPARILFIQIRRLGDVVISTPLLADLKRHFSNAQIDFLVGHAAAPLLENNPFIDRVLTFQPKRMLQMWRSIRRGRYDWIIDVQAHPRTAILSLLSGVPVRIGWDARFWGIAYTHRAPRVTTPMYSGQNRQRLLALAGVPTGSPLPEIFLTDEERVLGARDMFLHGDTRPLVGLALTAADPARNWSVEGFAAVASELQRLGHRVAVFRFPGDSASIDLFRANSRAGELIEWRDDRRFLAQLAQCDVLVSPNTGPCHMATALGVPRVTLYDSLSAKTWSPPLPTAVALSNPAQPCLGCRGTHCPVQRACIKGITPGQVVGAVVSIVQSGGRHVLTSNQ